MMDFNIIDAHSHLWLRQDTEVNGLPIRTLTNGRSLFIGGRTSDGSALYDLTGGIVAEVFSLEHGLCTSIGCRSHSGIY